MYDFMQSTYVARRTEASKFACMLLQWLLACTRNSILFSTYAFAYAKSTQSWIQLGPVSFSYQLITTTVQYKMMILDCIILLLNIDSEITRPLPCSDWLTFKGPRIG